MRKHCRKLWNQEKVKAENDLLKLVNQERRVLVNEENQILEV